jgi:hypothetical protein
LMYSKGRQLDPRDHERLAVVDGGLGAFVGAVKVSQLHTWVYVLRRRPAAAALGLALVGIVGLATLPLVRSQAWFDWLDQLRRAADPAWGSIGFPLTKYLGEQLGMFIGALSLVAVFVVPPRQAGAWIGILTIVGSASPHIFTILFLLPAMRLVPRAIGLLAALLVASYAAALIWAAILLVAVTLALSGRDLRVDRGIARAVRRDNLAP